MTEAERTPIPDPTRLTTAQLLRELGSARDILEATIAGKVELLNAHVGALNHQISQLWSVHDLVPRQIAEKVDTLRHLHEERLGHLESLLQERNLRFDHSLVEYNDHIKSLLHERDLRFDQSDKEVKTALTVAFSAQKETADKSEANVIKQIDAQAAVIQTVFKSLDDKITDSKERLTRIEAANVGSGQFRSSQLAEQSALHGGNQNIIAIVCAVIAALARCDCDCGNSITWYTSSC